MNDLFTILRSGGNSEGAGSRIIWSKEQIAYIIDKYNKTHSVPQIAEQFDCSADAIRRLLRKKKIKLITVQENWKNQYPKNSNYFEKIDSKDKAYWLGFLYADGYNNNQRGQIRINLMKSDGEHLKKFLNCIKAYNTPIKYSKKEDKNTGKIYEGAYISFVDRKISDDLCKLGCIPKKSLVLDFPSEDILPKEYIYHFIRGYFDGDGSLYIINTKHKSNLVYFCMNITGTEKFLNKVKVLLGKDNVALEHKENHCVLHIGGNKQIKKILNNLYQGSDSNIELARKKSKYELLLLQCVGGELRNLGCG